MNQKTCPICGSIIDIHTEGWEEGWRTCEACGARWNKNNSHKKGPPPMRIGITVAPIVAYWLDGQNQTQSQQMPAGMLMAVDDASGRGRFLDPHGGPTAYGCPASAVTQLLPEPGVVTWTPEDSDAASNQGWDIFGDPIDGFCLQRVDADPRFKSDEEAGVFVWLSAVSGANRVAQRALAFLRNRAHQEYDRISSIGRKL